MRELRLLSAHKPAYNRRSKNPKQAWWLTLTDEAFPRLSLVRTPRDGALGPFRSRGMAEDAMVALQDGTGIRPCTVRIPAQRAAANPCALAELPPVRGAVRRSAVGRGVRAVGVVVRVAGGRASCWIRCAVLERRLRAHSAAERFEQAGFDRDRLSVLVRTLDRGQRLAALAAVPELVAARPDGTGGWEFAVVRHGRLASAGVARRGVPPMPVVDAIVAASRRRCCRRRARYAARPPRRSAVVLRWLDRAGDQDGSMLTAVDRACQGGRELARLADQGGRGAERGGERMGGPFDLTGAAG